MFFSNLLEIIFGTILICSSIGILIVKKPVHASLCFLLTLLSLSMLYLQLSAQFIAVMQILVYAGAILVIFMFVIILFQDAYQRLDLWASNSSKILLGTAALSFTFALLFVGIQFLKMPSLKKNLPEKFGMVEPLGKALYIDFFFPFEAVILLFLVALVGALYIGRKEK